jgi:Secretion system C-terminal sorting domain
MKKLYFLFGIVLINFCSVISSAQTATNTAANFQVINNATQFTFEIYTLRTSTPVYRMGLSTFVLNFAPGALTNPVLSNQNPRYSTGNYGPMSVVTFFNRQVGVQINYMSGPGEIVSNDTGATGFGELIATVTMDILNPGPANMTWDPSSSDIVTPTFVPIIFSLYQGGYNGPLPVELASFTSSVLNNKVTLNWTTSSEENNSGFGIERSTVNGEWSTVNFVEGSGNSNSTQSYSYEDRNLTSGKYRYRLKQIDFNGNFKYYELQNEVEIGIPDRFELSQNYPNPFNPSTKINFSLPSDSKVSLKIYDISGRLVSTLINNEFKTADYHTIGFNATNLSSGTYFYSIQTDKNSETKRMVLIK